MEVNNPERTGRSSAGLAGGALPSRAAANDKIAMKRSVVGYIVVLCFGKE
jgi:hypothetical protein